MHYIFAISIFLFFNDSFGLDDFDISVIEENILEEKRITTPVQARVQVNTIDSEKSRVYKFKGESLNNIQWDLIDENEWLSFDLWKENNENSNLNQAAVRKVMRELAHTEIMGRVIKCLGNCFNYRGVKRVRAQYLTQLKEGDEFSTLEDSYAWIFLMDGSLVRLSPNSSITLQEINVSQDDFFIMLRLNNGFMSFIPRSSKTIKSSDLAQTDLGFLPIQISNANQEFFAIQQYRSLNKSEKYAFSLKAQPGLWEQYQKLNELIKENNTYMQKRKTRFYLFTPNFSVEGENNPVHMFYEAGGDGIFSISNKFEFNEAADELIETVISKRGYNNIDVFSPQWDQWYEVDAEGSIINTKLENTHLLNANLALLKRIPSLLLAREIWLDKFMKPMLSRNLEEREVAEKFGYRLWNVQQKNEKQKRINFIREYIRRIETTNIHSLIKLLSEKKQIGFDRSYLKLAMEKHYKHLKKKYSEKQMKIFNFSDVDYYLWILKNARN